jgi:ketosteroid isomerase-like protein
VDATPTVMVAGVALLNWRVALTHKEIFERYLYAAAITRNPDAIAALFTEDGVYDAPLVPDDHPLHRLVGRDAIRAGTRLYHQQPTYQATMNLERTRYLLHDTQDPDIFMAEIDVAFDEADGRRTRMSLLQIFRVRDGQIELFRDYFAELSSLPTDPDHEVSAASANASG